MNRARLLAGLAATGATTGSAFAQGTGATTVTLGTTPVDSSGEPYYAVDSGIAKAAGLDVQLVPSQNGAAIAAAVASGALSIGNGNLVSVVLAHAKGIPFVLIAPAGLYLSKTPSTLMFVPKTSSARTGKDLNGKTIAVNTVNGLPQFSIAAWMDKNGGTSSSVKFVEMSSSTILVALQDGRIDAATVTEPYVTPARAIATPICAPLDAIGSGSGFLITAFFTTQAWAKANPVLVRRFQDMVAQTAAWANAHHDRSGAILVKYANLSDQTVRTMQRTVFAERLDVLQIQPIIELTAKYGGITPFPAQDLLPQL